MSSQDASPVEEPFPLSTLRHSVSHLMASAVEKLHPEVQFGFGPSIEHGFYYDFLLAEPLEEKELKKIDGREDRLVADFSAEYTNLSDARARAMLDEALRIDEDRVKLTRRWVDRMAPVLPPRLLVRYFQLENKFQAIVAADLARQIPLVP